MRYYDPGIARFMGRDMLAQAAAMGKLNPRTVQNRYLFADNAPSVFVDPMGLKSCPSPNDAIRDPSINPNPGVYAFAHEAVEELGNILRGMYRVKMLTAFYRLPVDFILAAVPAKGVAGTGAKAAVKGLLKGLEEMDPEKGLTQFRKEIRQEVAKKLGEKLGGKPGEMLAEKISEKVWEKAVGEALKAGAITTGGDPLKLETKRPDFAGWAVRDLEKEGDDECKCCYKGSFTWKAGGTGKREWKPFKWCIKIW